MFSMGFVVFFVFEMPVRWIQREIQTRFDVIPAPAQPLRLRLRLLQMISELMIEILENLLGKCGNRMISAANALGMDSYGSVRLRKDA